jgi:hypothetical protein
LAELYRQKAKAQLQSSLLWKITKALVIENYNKDNARMAVDKNNTVSSNLVDLNGDNMGLEVLRSIEDDLVVCPDSSQVLSEVEDEVFASHFNVILNFLLPSLQSYTSNISTIWSWIASIWDVIRLSSLPTDFLQSKLKEFKREDNGIIHNEIRSYLPSQLSSPQAIGFSKRVFGFFASFSPISFASPSNNHNNVIQKEIANKYWNRFLVISTKDITCIKNHAIAFPSPLMTQTLLESLLKKSSKRVENQMNHNHTDRLSVHNPSEAQAIINKFSDHVFHHIEKETCKLIDN